MSIRRWWNSLFSQEIEFQVLKSASAVELSAYNSGRRRQKSTSTHHRQRCNIPRFYSAYDHLLKDETPPVSEISIKRSDQADNMLIAFKFYSPPDPHTVTVTANYRKSSKSPVKEQCRNFRETLADCYQWQSSDKFIEGMTIESILCQDDLFPCLNYGLFNRDPNCKPVPKKSDLYVEVSSAVRNGTEAIRSVLPVNKHAGYLVIGFKLLPDEMPNVDLDTNWVDWTGARDITRFCPAAWELMHMTFYKIEKRYSREAFAYVLFCHFENILHPGHEILAREMTQRLRARRHGYVGLYATRWTYSKNNPVKYHCSDVAILPDVLNVDND